MTRSPPPAKSEMTAVPGSSPPIWCDKASDAAYHGKGHEGVVWGRKAGSPACSASARQESSWWHAHAHGPWVFIVAAYGTRG